MAKSVERYFRFMPVGRRARLAGRLWRPNADVYKTSEGWIVKLDLAGISREDLEGLELEIGERTLRITGCRHDTFYGEGIAYHQLEITYSRFERTLHFPCSIEGTSIERDYRDGLLILRLRHEVGCKEEAEREQ